MRSCILWDRAKTGGSSGGYANAVVSGKNVVMHKFLWEQKYGPVPRGKELDHICRNKSCINTEHLEPVSHAENLRRGWAAKRKHCLRGHNDWTTRKGAYGAPIRTCKTCRKAQQKRAYLRRKNAKLV